MLVLSLSFVFILRLFVVLILRVLRLLKTVPSHPPILTLLQTRSHALTERGRLTPKVAPLLLLALTQHLTSAMIKHAASPLLIVLFPLVVQLFNPAILHNIDAVTVLVPNSRGIPSVPLPLLLVPQRLHSSAHLLVVAVLLLIVVWPTRQIAIPNPTQSPTVPVQASLDLAKSVPLDGLIVKLELV